MSAAKKLDVIPVADWMRGCLLPQVFGITAEAARKYRDRGVWAEGKHYRKDPVGQYVYNRDAISAWMGGKV
ncbi:DNA-binding protein [Ectopseudomonas mendocina]|nr:DNA-binding protein [Pseudomonas mendocina]TRO10898.1 DNA-binding protein [Pseudomonas mendocina]